MKSKSLEKSSEAQYKSYIETMEDWLWECDHKGVILFSSPSVKKLLGYGAEEILGKNVFSLMIPDDHEEILLQFDERHALPPSTLPIVTRLYSKEGSLVWFDSKITVIEGVKGKRKRYRVLSRDLSEMKRLEALRHEVTSVISHEIRTPLTAIHGSLSLMVNQSMTPEETQEFITIAYKNSLRLKDLVERMLDIRDSEAGLLKYDFEILDLKKLIREEVKKFKSKQIKIKLNRGPSPNVRGDKKRLGIVLNNLLSNALNASSKESLIVVSIQTSKGRVRVAVTDKGEGIPKSFKPIIFDKFVQTSSTLTRKNEGAGLGLNLSRHIIDGHGGIIDFISEEGIGSTFYFELPTVKKS